MSTEETARLALLLRTGTVRACGRRRARARSSVLSLARLTEADRRPIGTVEAVYSEDDASDRLFTLAISHSKNKKPP